MIITRKPACSIVAGDILVYDQMSDGERETAEVLSSCTDGECTAITYPDRQGKPTIYEYHSDELLNCVDIEAEARALLEEMESKPEYKAVRKEQEG